MEALARARPELGALVTSGTVTSAQLLARRLPEGAIHQYAPVDTPEVARRFLQAWRPDLAVFVESEVWPNLLTAARDKGVRTALISARLSSASLGGWARTRRTAQALFGGFDLVLAQDDATAEGLAALGARDDGRLNLKLAGAPLAFDPQALQAERSRLAGRRMVLAASTHPGEDEIALDAFSRLNRPGVVLVIAPRHPERGSSIAALAHARGLAAGLRSAGAVLGETPVHVADTLGELGLWYALSDSALVGGSLLPGPGGHNPLEPARLAAPALSGPHVDNWRGVFEALAPLTPVAADGDDLARLWAEDLDDPAAARGRGEAAKARARALAPDLDALTRRLLGLVDRAG